MDLILFQFAPHAILVKIRGVNSEEHGSQIPLVGQDSTKSVSSTISSLLQSTLYSVINVIKPNNLTTRYFDTSFKAKISYSGLEGKHGRSTIFYIIIRYKIKLNKIWDCQIAEILDWQRIFYTLGKKFSQ